MQIRVDLSTFEDLKIAAINKDLDRINDIINNIEMEILKRDILRAAYTRYKKTGRKEYLHEYIKLKSDNT